MKLIEIAYADAIPELNITDISAAKQVSEIDNQPVWSLSDSLYQILFFKQNKTITAYIAVTLAKPNGYVDLVRVHNRTSTKGMITALLHAARQLGYKFRISHTEPLTPEGIEWLCRLIQAGGRGFVITDQDHNAIDANQLRSEWKQARMTDSIGPTGVFIEGRTNSSIGKSLLERYPSKWLKPASRFIGDASID